MIKFYFYHPGRSEWIGILLKNKAKMLHGFHTMQLMHNYSLKAKIGIPDILDAVMEDRIKDFSYVKADEHDEYDDSNDTENLRLIFEYLFDTNSDYVQSL